jgi:hypothetical protein
VRQFQRTEDATVIGSQDSQNGGVIRWVLAKSG